MATLEEVGWGTVPDDGTGTAMVEGIPKIVGNIKAVNTETEANTATLAKYVAFSATGGVAQTIPYNVVTRLTGLTNINFNKGNGYSGSQFTAPVAGIYDIRGSISMAGTSGSAVSAPWSQILLYKNGASIGGAYNFGAVRSDGYGSIAANWLVELAAGDILTLYLIQVILNAGVSIGANSSSAFSGVLIR